MVVRCLDFACLMTCYKPVDRKEFVQMTSKKHTVIVYGVAALLFLVAVVCYAAFPVQPPEEPLRLMYQTMAGKVLFDHQTHSAADGYALDCADCHHDHPEGEPVQEVVACGLCHPIQSEKMSPPEFCLDCHDEEELEEPAITKRSDAIHQQCTQCHLEYGSGPLYQNALSNEEKDQPNEWIDCNKCHVL